MTMIDAPPTCDIVLPVYNGLTFAAEAIESVIEGTERGAYRLIIVDDGSDRYTAEYLRRLAAREAQITLLRHTRNLGFVQSCLDGYRASTAPFLLLLNSDVVVPPGWLERLLDAAAADPRIASVNPLTNHAAHLVVPMWPGANYLGMDNLLHSRRPDFPDVVTGEGFCLLLRRSALDEVGFFDPVFGHGYCEESDLCMRLTTNGYRTVVADHLYVYHRGSATFGTERGPRYLENRRIFDARWRDDYRRQFAHFRATDPLRSARTMIQHKMRWEPRPVIWRTGRALRTAWRARQPLAALKAAGQGVLALRHARSPLPQIEALQAACRPARLRVTYIVDRLLLSGGVLSVIQLVNALIRRGVEARIATLFEDPLVQEWTRLYTRPIVYRHPTELIERFPPSDIVVATLWTTAPWARALVDSGRARAGVYLLQDYEPWFFPERDTAKRAAVQATFGLLEHRIVMSDWLAAKLAAHGLATHKIPLGMDLRCFYPRDTSAHPLTLTAMARPGTPYRGFDTIIAAFEHVKTQRPDARIHLFGDDNLHRRKIAFPFVNEGVITDQNRLAELYAMTDVFVDGSDFQGFGRCGLEAMACGAACVLTNVGGVNEYARHDHNAKLVPPRAPDRLAEAILALLDDRTTRARLADAGRDTAQAFGQDTEAQRTLAFFTDLATEHPAS